MSENKLTTGAASRSTHLPTETKVDVRGARRPTQVGTWVGAAVVLVFFAQLIVSLAGNGNLDWPIVGHYLFDSSVLRGLLTSLFMTAVAMLIGMVLGVVLVVCRISRNVVLNPLANAYIWFFRATPLLVQLIFWFNIALLFPRLNVGLPFGPVFVSVPANSVVTPLLAAFVGLGLHESAYQAEIYRAGLLSVDEGQADAAKSLGMRATQIFFTIRLPQAMRFIIPPTFSQLIGMVKGTSIVSVIGGAELLFSVQQIYALNFKPIPLLIVAAFWYLLVTSVLSIIQYFIERHYARGTARTQARSKGWTSRARIRLGGQSITMGEDPQ